MVSWRANFKTHLKIVMNRHITLNPVPTRMFQHLDNPKRSTLRLKLAHPGNELVAAKFFDYAAIADGV